MEEQTFHVNEFFDKRHAIQKFFVFIFPVPVKLDLRDWGRFKRVDFFEVLVSNCVFYTDAFSWIESQQL